MRRTISDGCDGEAARETARPGRLEIGYWQQMVLGVDLVTPHKVASVAPVGGSTPPGCIVLHDGVPATVGLPTLIEPKL